MKKLTITLETAKEMYKQCDQSIKALLLENFTKEELEEKELPKSWEDLICVNGYYITEDSTVEEVYPNQACTHLNRNIWPTKEYAEASLALAQLLQLRDTYNDGDVLDFKNDIEKYVIFNFKEKPITKYAYKSNHILCFKTEKLRDIFLENHSGLITQALPLL